MKNFYEHPRDLVPLTLAERERLAAGATYAELRADRKRLNAKKDRHDPRGGDPYNRTGEKAVP